MRLAPIGQVGQRCDEQRGDGQPDLRGDEGCTVPTEILRIKPSAHLVYGDGPIFQESPQASRRDRPIERLHGGGSERHLESVDAPGQLTQEFRSTICH